MKIQRQQTLLQIVQTQSIETQEDLTRALREAGFAVTQATVSRDIKELRLVKTLGADGRYVYTTVKSSRDIHSTKLHRLFHDAVRKVDYAGNMVVVQCLSGTAGAVCAAADAMELPSIVGSLAGDDTIMFVVRTEADALALTQTLCELAEM